MSTSTNTKNIVVNKKYVNNNNINGASKMIGANDMNQTNDAKQMYWKGMLRRHDNNKDGVISKKELNEAFNKAGASMPGWCANRAMRWADKNHDGFIEAAELPYLLEYAHKKGYVL